LNQITISINENDFLVNKDKPKKRVKNLVVNTTRAGKDSDLLEKVIDKNGWKEMKGQAGGTVYWFDGGIKNPDKAFIKKQECHYNRYPYKYVSKMTFIIRQF
jgi:hypothetical protein